MRNTPKQPRSHRKVDFILSTSQTVFAEVGFDNATTNMIATRAGVSVGSLYQFFTSKEAILEEMATRYLEQTDAALAQAYQDAANLPLPEAITSILHLSIRQQEQRPRFLQSLPVSSPSVVLAPLLARLNELVVQRSAILITRHHPGLDAKQATLRAQIMASATGGMLPLALRAKGRERQHVLEEITTLLVQYASTPARLPA